MSAPERVRPFDRPFTQFHNALLDHLMPCLSPSAWKVACFFVRQLNGWHRTEIRATVEQIQSGTGLGSSNTVSRALDELIREDGTGFLRAIRHSRRRPTEYALNLDFELQIGEVVRCGDSERISQVQNPSTSKSESLSTSNSESLIKESLLKKIRIVNPETGFDRIPHSLSDLRRTLIDGSEKRDASKQVAYVRWVMGLIYGEQDLPDFARVGRFRKDAGSTARAIEILFRYAAHDVTGNPILYISAAEKRLRDERRDDPRPILPRTPEHLKSYPTQERDYLVSRGADPSRFFDAGRDGRGEPLYRFIDPSLDPEPVR
jgi:hypothetical protein